MAQPSYAIQFAPLSTQNSQWGRIGLLPWDAEMFGFGVAQFAPGDYQQALGREVLFIQTLEAWSAANGVLLISCALPESDRGWPALLQRSGFNFVEYSLRASLARLQSVKLSVADLPVRIAEDVDVPGVEHIAESSIPFGRYQADPLFPTVLANARYRRWVSGALATASDENRVYVVGPRGNPVGFFHVVLKNGLVDMRLCAVDRNLAEGFAGLALIVNTLRILSKAGAKSATAKVSAANIAVLNLYSMLGFRFSEPQAIYHFHAAAMPH